jgi:cell division protein FtsB
MSRVHPTASDTLLVVASRYKKALAQLRRSKAALVAAKAEIARLHDKNFELTREVQMLKWSFSENEIIKRVREQWEFQQTREETFQIASREKDRHIATLTSRIIELERKQRSVVHHLKLINE